MRKRLYVLDCPNDLRFAMVETSPKKAKKRLWGDEEVQAACQYERTFLNALVETEVDVSHRGVGDDMHDLDGLVLNVYAYVNGIRCPRCKIGPKNIKYQSDWRTYCCNDCDTELYEEWKADRKDERRIARTRILEETP